MRLLVDSPRRYDRYTAKEIARSSPGSSADPSAIIGPPFQRRFLVIFRRRLRETRRNRECVASLPSASPTPHPDTVPVMPELVPGWLQEASVELMRTVALRCPGVLAARAPEPHR
jgi:hypothetical protein